ncbi:MAG TPA: hypothetical protein VJT75_14620 [Thermoleophilaceae bacterium]|nr:hypothetical protein [Thermoleophilaceae bacterium]
MEQKLDLLIALTRVGVRHQLEAELKEIESDPVGKAILQKARDEIAAGPLKTAVMKATKQSEPTVKRRLGELVARGALSRTGAGRNVTYRNTGLFDL